MALTKEVLGYSALVEATIEPQRGVFETNYTFSVEIIDLTDIYYGNISTEVTTVVFDLYSDGERITCHYLTEVSENIFAYNIIGFEEFGDYQIDLEINSYGFGKEVIRDVTFSTVRKIAPGFELFVAMVSLTAIWFVVMIKRK
ncbi:MAG: hypothetical protein EAX90_10465 [Candidatus Heimdallarchaeota archaeon]|nr:hypothetical protein [Candidatus Heimdallarchaeota archaeon]